MTSEPRWAGASAAWFGSSLLESSPFNTAWRREKGALWDLGPHLVSVLWELLGPVTSVTADAGLADTSHLILHHQGGPTSTVTVSQSAAEGATGFEAYAWGEAGRSVAPAGTSDPLVPLRTALAELTGRARSGLTAHPCDVRFGRDVVRVLAEAERQIGARARPAA
ncbi:MAG: hypothetical protein M3Z75_00155 [Actinomycetota bacterium]|nr:hypothetical protein [Actinomycetota bacterium]